MENYPKAVHITDWFILSVYAYNVDDLWSYIAWSATANIEIFLLIWELCDSKAPNNTVPAALLPEHEVLWFEASMHDVFTVHFLKSSQDRGNDLLSLIGLEIILLKYVLIFDFVGKCSSLEQLHHHINRIFRLKNLKEFHAIIMVKTPHNFYLFDEALFPFFLTVNEVLRKSFHCIFFTILRLLNQINWG